MWDNVNQNISNNSNTEDENSKYRDDITEDSNVDELSLDYLPNELKYIQKYHNDEADIILQGPQTQNQNMLVEFFRGITLCHQINVTKDMKRSLQNMYQYVGVFNDEIASLEFAQHQQFKLV